MQKEFANKKYIHPNILATIIFSIPNQAKVTKLITNTHKQISFIVDLTFSIITSSSNKRNDEHECYIK